MEMQIPAARTDRPSLTPSILVLNTGAPQGCVLSTLLFTLYTLTWRKLKLVDDNTTIGRISNNDEASYREEIHTQKTTYCSISKTKEVIVDF